MSDLRYVNSTALVSQIQARHNMPNIQLAFDSIRGFHMQFCVGRKQGASMPEIPAEFIHVTKKRNVVCFTTKDMVSTPHPNQ